MERGPLFVSQVHEIPKGSFQPDSAECQPSSAHAMSSWCSSLRNAYVDQDRRELPDFKFQVRVPRTESPQRGACKPGAPEDGADQRRGLPKKDAEIARKLAFSPATLPVFLPVVGLRHLPR
ncbi:hypothetical protein AAFF_G00049190 [Aldrovandia affinis]|uniref:Uncharacterized protein n=1 Tax=Aldrovandia affinis TaxID=143900 RepID=A0AAD7S192_9TELE|nr:hypothetical protein AAFF_G00049190 [Aldrovandia affinis]